MKVIKFEGLELHIDENDTLSSREVALGYGVSSSTIREHKKQHSDEILKNIHYIEVWDDKFKRYVTRWTLEGVHMLGFFIKSERAKEFRKFTAKLLTEIKKGNAQVVATGCKADQVMTPRIMAYKSNLVQRNKKIKELEAKLKECQNGNEQIRWIVEHNLLDLAGELARHNKELLEFAQHLENIAKELEERSKDAQFFLENILKYFPKAAGVARRAQP